MASRTSITTELRRLGMSGGDVLMVHASLKKIGPVVGGAHAIVGALCHAVAPAGTLMGYASWDRSPYGETLNGAQLDEEMRHNWPPFKPDTARVYPGFSLLNQFLVDTPGALRSAHPDASTVAVGPHAAELIEPHRLGQAFGPGSPLERFVKREGKVLMFGAPLDSVTVLHYAEAIADIPTKRRVTYEMPLLGPNGQTVWERAEDFDSSGILDCFANDGEMDAVETIARAYVALRRHQEGRVANAHCYLLDAQDIVSFGASYLEQRFAGWAGTPVEGS
ncbi:aminoglycoside 3-N-acetyltransferase [Microvirga lotononidis]|uniref:Aminoglycoside N(3)-acetyltransferase n=1 Tax=Microvirga lotononidis TaxID=864069 RepID=I4YQJ7_9HYPH|nr:aminoglycoside 3-N-acetyltransferase [Microvirga lotononidis]EIM26239.1 aminoglycoside N3'-acetyltransferase [Microvirga lotononidis]WQO30621.1 aminoglycoside 3-N-acetyltransferase [Microvirga lotononidis]